MRKKEAADLLSTLNLGSEVAERDNLLESARVETSVFEDLLADKVDLVPGTKGSGKTALYRIFVDFLPALLLKDRKVVIAHGIHKRQDTVFLAYREHFEKLSEGDFIDFWCIYLISLAYEQFIRSRKYIEYLKDSKTEIAEFRKKYEAAGIPDFERKQSLKEIISWTLHVVKRIKPRVSWKPPGDVGQIDLFFDTNVEEASEARQSNKSAFMTAHIEALVTSLEQLLSDADLSLWLMIDRLDELFARRSNTERKALRGLLHTIRLVRSERIRVKVFLRDDILDEIVADEGFTALSHVAARRSDTLRWSEEQILAMLIRRIYASEKLHERFGVDDHLLMTSPAYQRQLFYKIFPETVHRPPNQSATLRWIYNHTKDGRGVVTPRDVIILVTRACQRQWDEFRRDPEGGVDRLISGPAIIYGLEELSKEKRNVYLAAEFPHKWDEIRKLMGGGTEYNETALKRIFGKKYQQIKDDLLSLGILERATRSGDPSFKIPYLYRRGLECTQKFISR